MPRRRTNPWHDIFAFLVLTSATLVMVIVLKTSQVYYPQFEERGRYVVWVVVFGSVLALASLAWRILQLYITPVLTNGRHRRKRNP